MTACLQVVASQIAAVTSDLPDACVGYVVATGAEYQSLQALASVWEVPATQDLQNAFMAGVSLPLIAYLTAWAYGRVIHFLESKD